MPVTLTAALRSPWPTMPCARHTCGTRAAHVGTRPAEAAPFLARFPVPKGSHPALHAPFRPALSRPALPRSALPGFLAPPVRSRSVPPRPSVFCPASLRPASSGSRPVPPCPVLSLLCPVAFLPAPIRHVPSCFAPPCSPSVPTRPAWPRSVPSHNASSRLAPSCPASLRPARSSPASLRPEPRPCSCA